MQPHILEWFSAFNTTFRTFCCIWNPNFISGNHFTFRFILKQIQLPWGPGFFDKIIKICCEVYTKKMFTYKCFGFNELIWTVVYNGYRGWSIQFRKHGCIKRKIVFLFGHIRNYLSDWKQFIFSKILEISSPSPLTTILMFVLNFLNINKKNIQLFMCCIWHYYHKQSSLCHQHLQSTGESLFSVSKRRRFISGKKIGGCMKKIHSKVNFSKYVD